MLEETLLILRIGQNENVEDTDNQECNAYPFKPHFYIANFLIFDPKHTLWVLVRTASRVPTMYALSENIKKIHCFYFSEKQKQNKNKKTQNLCLLHGHVFVML